MSVSNRIAYVIQDCSQPGEPAVIGEGVKLYTDADWIVIDIADPERPWRSFMLPLEQGFGIGTSVFSDPVMTGFGLWVEKDSRRAGFSWEWFVRRSPGRFGKLQESGLLRVKTHGQPQFEELARITFETDVSLRYKSYAITRDLMTITHRVDIERGSVIRIPS